MSAQECAEAARAGQRVLVVTDRRKRVQPLLDQLLPLFAGEEVSKIYRAHGTERIELRSGGVLQFVPVSGIRGMSADLVWLTFEPASEERAVVAVAANNGRLI